MNKIMPWIFSITFLAGIVFIITSDSGIVTDYLSATIAGILISIFSGIYLGIWLLFYCKLKIK